MLPFSKSGRCGESFPNCYTVTEHRFPEMSNDMIIQKFADLARETSPAKSSKAIAAEVYIDPQWRENPILNPS
jgi:hypothetical protein